MFVTQATTASAILHVVLLYSLSWSDVVLENDVNRFVSIFQLHLPTVYWISNRLSKNANFLLSL